MKLKSPFLNREARVELVSLMDVMFLVLVFFIYSVFEMAVHKGLKVDLPRAVGAHERGERLVITIDASDALQLNGRAMAREQLVKEVGRLVSVKPVPVLVSGDRKASLGTGIELLAELKAAGVGKAAFQVDGRKSAVSIENKKGEASSRP